MDEKEVNNTRKPKDSDFRQQRLRAWQPLLTPVYITGIFLCVGVVFCVIGAIILTTTYRIVELKQRYDNLPTSSSSSSTCSAQSATSSPSPSCFAITIPASGMSTPVYVYYQLTNFYQNHRRYVKSRSDGQLQGQSHPTLSTCDPLQANDAGETYYPCGLIAASAFNDTINATLCTSSAQSSCNDLSAATFTNSSNPTWQKTGIAWPSDVDNKFHYSLPSYPYTNYSADEHRLPYVEDEDFIVWMRTSGLPTFKKLYRVINSVSLPASSVVVFSVANQFPVDSYHGEKWIVMSETSWMGGRNTFLGWTYVTVGVCCVVVGTVFGVKHCVRPRRLGEITAGRRAVAEDEAGNGEMPKSGVRGDRGGGNGR